MTDKTDNDGKTPLHDAASAGQTKTALALVNAGADINAKDNYDQTPLNLAVAGGYTEIALILLGAGADVGARDDNGSTPLHIATRNGQTATTLALVKVGADVGAKNNDGWTPLHDAAWQGEISAALALAKAGADLHARSGDNKTPTDIAIQRYGEKSKIVLALRGAMENSEKKMPANHQAKHQGLGLIYIATCIITEKSYVGQTTNTLEERRARHWEAAEDGSRGCLLFYDALRRFPHEKYWRWRVLHRCPYDKLDDAEEHFIAKYSRHPRGYNWQGGGGEYEKMTEDDFIPPSGSLL